MVERAFMTTRISKLKSGNSAFKAQRANLSQSIYSPIDHILFLQRTIGNHAVQRLFKSGAIQERTNSSTRGNHAAQEADLAKSMVFSGDLSHSFFQSHQSVNSRYQRNVDPIEIEGSPKTTTNGLPSKSMPKPTGIEKTEPDKQKLHFGAHYKHTFKSSGGSLEGIDVTEKVTKVKDDFQTNLPGVELGKIKTKINKKGEIGDTIWLSFGAIAPSIERLRKKKEPGEMLLGEMVDKQELHYWENREPAGWKWFANVKIEFRLYDAPGLVVATLDNEIPADFEEFTPFPPSTEKKREGP